MSQSLAQLFLQATGKKVGSQVALTASGSNRRYYRITSMDGSVSLIGVQGTSRDENKAFLEMAKHFKSQGLNVPEVKAVSDDEMAYVQEDLGDTLLFDYIADGRKTGSFCEREKALLRKTMRALAVFQVKGADKFNFSIHSFLLVGLVLEFVRSNLYPFISMASYLPRSASPKSAVIVMPFTSNLTVSQFLI